MAEETQRSGTSSDRMLSVMDLFTPEQPEWTVEQACVAMGQSESTVYRYFRSLAAVGLIFSIRPGRYLLGPGIIHYERQLRLSDPLIRAAEPAVVKMAAEYAEQGLIFLSRIYRDSVMTTHEHRISAEPFPEGAFGRGRLAPLFRGAPGLALLSFLEVRTVRSIYQRVDSGDAEWLAFKRRMRAVRGLGYAVGVDDPDPGVLHVSIPLKQDGHGIAGSLTVALASGPDNAAAIEKSAALLAVAAKEIALQARKDAPE
ncbi:IclR family transcriptional regulator [Streptomyces griseorubiginosus]|nr:helix-turn-helix domain-containing protein [Streptomyces griseorubiginosus]